jgi:hypothetical protein
MFYYQENYGLTSIRADGLCSPEEAEVAGPGVRLHRVAPRHQSDTCRKRRLKRLSHEMDLAFDDMYILLVLSLNRGQNHFKKFLGAPMI